MKFKTLTGSMRTITKINKYLVKWNGKSRSKFQKSVKTFLKPYWKGHVVFEEFPIAGTRMTFDFYNANKKIAIEMQGRQHTQYVPFFHGNKMNYLSQLRRDHDKMDFCKLNKIKLIEVYDDDEISVAFFKKNKLLL